MFGESGDKLILEARRTSNLPEVTLYQSQLVEDILREINDLNKDVEYLVREKEVLDAESNTHNEDDKRVNNCQTFTARLTMRRNKRCILAYERLRANKIDEFCWLNVDPTDDPSNNNVYLKSGTLGSNYTTQLALDNLSHPEQEYYRQYQALLVDYKSKFSDIDLSGDLEPPTNIFIDVRVLKDGGEVQTEYGVFNLIKDSQFYVRKSDVDRLIQQGYLEEL